MKKMTTTTMKSQATSLHFLTTTVKVSAPKSCRSNSNCDHNMLYQSFFFLESVSFIPLVYLSYRFKGDDSLALLSTQVSGDNFLSRLLIERYRGSQFDLNQSIV